MIREKFSKKNMLVIGAWYAMLYKLNRLPREAAYRRVLFEMGQYPVARMIEMMDRGFEKNILPRLYKRGAELVHEHREMEHHTVIATAAGEYIAERVRAQLLADDFIASPMPVEGDHFASHANIPMAFMHGKVAMVEQYCLERGVDLDDCWFYSDSASDMPLLGAVGHPVMVNPQLVLRITARGMNWPVLRFKEYADFKVARRPESVKSPELNRFLQIYERERENVG